MKANSKITLRLFTKHIMRFLTIIAIVIIGIGFMAGILENESKIDSAVNTFYKNQNVSDFYIKSKSEDGFSSQDLAYFSGAFAEQDLMFSFSYELDIGQDLVRLQCFDFANININKFELLEGELPESSTEVVVERQTNTLKGFEVGDTISVYGMNFTVCGIVLNPLMIYKEDEVSFTDVEKNIDNVVYFNTSVTPLVNDVYVTIGNREIFNVYSAQYKTEVTKISNAIYEALGADKVQVITLYENAGLYSLDLYSEKVSLIGIIFVVFFFLIIMLVIYSTMSRLLAEERAKNACLKTLGYADWRILIKYIYFVALGTLLGGLIAYSVAYGLTSILYSAFGIQYAMPPMPTGVSPVRYVIVFAIILVSAIVLTALTAWSAIKQKPITLLTPKAPKQGRKVLLEKVPFVWNKLSFKYKSTLRNVFLFRSRFLMTIISIMGATILVLAGIGLMNCAMKDDKAMSLVSISAVLIVFSGALCALVIYNLTNINVSERNREIATLMVLGYNDREVTGYIYREIYIMSVIGALLGLPLGYGFLVFIFDLVDFGAIAEVSWWTWIVSPLVTIFFSFLSTKLLYRKIVKTDMNKSLKSLE